MAAPSAWTLYHNFKLYLCDGTFDLNSNTFKVALVASGYTPVVATHAVLADVTNELSTANGYTSGGVTVAATLNLAAGTVTFDTADAAWTASGGSIVARYAVLYASGTLNGRVNPLVAYCVLDSAPADVTATATSTLTIQVTNILTLA